MISRPPAGCRTGGPALDGTRRGQSCRAGAVRGLSLSGMATATISMDDALLARIQDAGGENLSEWIAAACRSKVLTDAAPAAREWERTHPDETCRRPHTGRGAQARATFSRPDESVSSITALLGVSRSTVYKYIPESSRDAQASATPGKANPC